MCEGEQERVSKSVCERERERERKGERECVCVRERECVHKRVDHGTVVAVSPKSST